MNQTTTYRTTRLVWLLASIGLATGAVTLAIVGAALWTVLSAKSHHDEIHLRLSTVVAQTQQAGQQADADLRRLLADQPPYDLAEHYHPPALDRTAIEILRRDDANLAGAFDRLSAALTAIDSVYVACRQWAQLDASTRAAQPQRRGALRERAIAAVDTMQLATDELRRAEVELTRRQSAALETVLQRAWRGLLLTAALALGFSLGVAWKLPRALTQQVQSIRQSADEIEGARRKLKAQNIALEQAQKRTEAAARGKGEFLAMVGHEFQRPVIAMLGYCDILLSRPLAADAREAVLALQRNGQQLLSVVSDILDLSKIEAGRLDVQPVPCSPVGLVREASELALPRCQGRQLVLATRLSGRFPAMIQADVVRLRQILNNLLATAIELAEQGPVVLNSQCSAGPAPRWTIELLTPGVFLSSGETERLFEPFAGPVHAPGRDAADLGLGLSISRQLAALLGGEIRVASSLRGTSLVLAMPVETLTGTPWFDPTAAEDQTPPHGAALAAALGAPSSVSSPSFASD
jgi:signal transduction histidine kinase